MRALVMTSALILAGLGAGCSSTDHRNTSPDPSPISHIVLAKLNDPSQTGLLLKESREKLSDISGIRFYWDGPALQTGRAAVPKDYDAAVIMGFDTPEDYRRYIEHPRHQDFVASWRPRLQSLRIFDVDTRSQTR